MAPSSPYSRFYPRERLVDAIHQARGRINHTAALLDVPRLRVYRLLGYLDLWSEVERARQQLLAPDTSPTATSLDPSSPPPPRRRLPPWWSCRRSA